MQLMPQDFQCQQYHEYIQLDMTCDHVCDLHCDYVSEYVKFRLNVCGDEYVFV